MAEQSIHRRLEQARLRARKTKAEVAHHFGLTQQAIGQWERTTTPAQHRHAEIAAYYDCDYEWLWSGVGTPDGPALPEPNVVPATDAPEPVAGTIPVYASAEAGDGEAVMSYEPIEYAARPGNLLNVNGAFAMYVVNDSMEPQLRQGHLVHVHPHKPVRPGDTVLVILAGGENQAEFHFMVKELVRRGPKAVTLRQHNPDSSFDVPVERVQRLYKIVGVAYD